MHNFNRRRGLVGSLNLGCASFALVTMFAGSLRAQTELITVSPTALTFPVTVKGKSSAPQILTVTSTGNTSVTLTTFAVSGTDASDFTITANTCGATLASGASCQVSITFKPAATGSRTATLTITDSATNSPQTVPLSGSGSNIVFSLHPTAITFPVVTVGSTNTSQVTATNIGVASATITSITVGGGDAGDFAISTKTCGTTLAAGASCTVNISFSPQFNGIRTSNLLFTDTAAGSPQAVSLTGTAQAAMQTLIFSPTSLVFNPTNVGSPAAVANVTVYNYGSSTITFNSTTVTGSNSSDFILLSNNCSPLAPNSSCAISVAFRPLAAGLRTAILLASDTAAGSPQSVPLSGVGVAGGALLTFSPTALSFNPTNLSSSSSLNVTISNDSSASAVFSNFAITGTNAADFAVTYNTCPIGSRQLAPQSICTIGITFAPSASGIRSASLSIMDNAIGNPQIISLTGTGQPLTKQLSFSNGTLTFGAQTVGQTTGQNSIYVMSVGAATVTLSSVVLGGANAADFTITNSTCVAGTMLAPMSQCAVQMTFTPSAAGARSASLSFADDAAGSPQIVALEGVGDTATQQLSFSNVNLDFGVLDVGSTASQNSVQVTNNGDAPVNFTTIVTAGTNAADFSITSDSCFETLTPTATCYVNVNFTPSATGVRTAQLVFTDSATGSPQTVGLSGDGQAVTEIVTFDYPSLVFPAQIVSTTSSQSVEYFNNNGDAPVLISSVSVTGGNASDFAISTNGCPVGGNGVFPGGYCYVYVTFTPAAAGLRTSTLQFIDSATGSPHNVPLIGVGTPAVVPLSLSPSDVGYNDQNVGTTSAATGVSVYNPGATALTLSIVLTGANASDFSILSNNCPASLGSGNSCTVNVIFKPTALGTRVAALQFTAGGKVVDVGVSGIGTTGSLVLTTQQLAVDFGPVNIAATSNQSSVLITNTGTETFTFSGFSLGGTNPSDFTISNNSCGSTLTVGAYCYVYITFTPAAVGVRTATLQIADNAVGSPQSVPLNGVGQAASMLLELPAPLAFPAVNIGTSYTQTIYVNNVGTANVTISSTSIVGTNAVDFTAVNTYCTGGGSVVTPGGYCAFNVSFAPTAAGVRTASLQLTDNATGSPQQLPLTGFAQTPTAALVVPPAVSFPLTTVGQTNGNTYFYIYNTGNSPVTITGTTFTGANAADFAVSYDECGGQLSAASNCYYQINFTPSGTGVRTATFQITDSAPGSPQSIPLNGVGQASTLTLSVPPPQTLPPAVVGTTSQNYYSYYSYNTGTSPVTLSNVTINGTNASEFTIADGSCTAGAVISPGSYCYLDINFTPLAVGNRTASIQFSDNATGSPQSTALNGLGLGLTDTATLEPGILSFGTVSVGSNSGDIVTYLQNTGSGPITITALGIVGTNPSDFVIDFAACSVGTQVSPGSSCYLYIYFTPTATGPRTATLQITDNAVGGAQTAALTGTGQ